MKNTEKGFLSVILVLLALLAGGGYIAYRLYQKSSVSEQNLPQKETQADAAVIKNIIKTLEDQRDSLVKSNNEAIDWNSEKELESASLNLIASLKKSGRDASRLQKYLTAVQTETELRDESLKLFSNWVPADVSTSTPTDIYVVDPEPLNELRKNNASLNSAMRNLLNEYTVTKRP